jgi:hypothetical protein
MHKRERLGNYPKMIKTKENIGKRKEKVVCKWHDKIEIFESPSPIL